MKKSVTIQDIFERLANPSQSNQIIHITSNIVPRSST